MKNWIGTLCLTCLLGACASISWGNVLCFNVDPNLGCHGHHCVLHWRECRVTVVYQEDGTAVPACRCLLPKPDPA